MRFLIKVTTNWCGMDQEYVAIASNEIILEDVASLLAYENFSDFDCQTYVLEELFPDVEDDFDEEMIEAANSVEGDYYGYEIEPWDETLPEEEWSWYDLVFVEDEDVIPNKQNND